MPRADDDPAFRSARGRYGAHVMHSRHDGREITAKAREAGPGGMRKWRELVDPDGVLDEAERERRAQHARKAWYARLSMLGANARRKR